MRQAKTGIKDISRKRDRQRDRTGGRNIDMQTKAETTTTATNSWTERRETAREVHTRDADGETNRRTREKKTVGQTDRKTRERGRKLYHLAGT